MITRSRYQEIAARLFNQTFGTFKDDVTLAQTGEVDYENQSLPVPDITFDNTEGIRSEYDKSELDGESIQIGDYKVLVLQQGLNTDVRADNVSMTFGGISVNIKSIEEDPAQAMYTIQVREL